MEERGNVFTVVSNSVVLDDATEEAFGTTM